MTKAKKHLFLFLATVFLLISCDNNSTTENLTNENLLAKVNQMNQTAKYSGVSIENGPRLGLNYTDIKGVQYYYRNIIAVITNDSTLPIQIKIGFSKEYYYPVPFNNQKFKVFIVPESIRKKQQFNSDVSEELQIFLDKELDNPKALKKIISPKETWTINIGVLTAIDYLDPGQIALISQGHKFHFYSHNNLLNQPFSTSKKLTLSLGLDFFSTYKKNPDSRECYSIIPCGQIVFAK